MHSAFKAWIWPLCCMMMVLNSLWVVFSLLCIVLEREMREVLFSLLKVSCLLNILCISCIAYWHLLWQPWQSILMGVPKKWANSHWGVTRGLPTLSVGERSKCRPPGSWRTETGFRRQKIYPDLSPEIDAAISLKSQFETRQLLPSSVTRANKTAGPQ